MNAESLVRRLAAFPATVQSLATGLSEDDARWKPASQHWSILEVCCHLLDEERDDFRVRLELLLRDPDANWPPLDLKDVATRRDYNSRDMTSTLGSFATERARSVKWLNSLPAQTNWNLTKTHPSLGALSAGSLLASWAAHDALHLRQIAKRLHELAARDGGTHAVGYAGDW